MTPPKPEQNDRDNKRAFRWAAIVAALLIVGALLFNVFWARKPPVNVDNAAQSAPAPQKPPGS